MPEESVIEGARRDPQEGKSASTQAGKNDVGKSPLQGHLLRLRQGHKLLA